MQNAPYVPISGRNIFSDRANSAIPKDGLAFQAFLTKPDNFK